MDDVIGRNLREMLSMVRFALATRERELITDRGPCLDERCRLHFDHQGPHYDYSNTRIDDAPTNSYERKAADDAHK